MSNKTNLLDTNFIEHLKNSVLSGKNKINQTLLSESMIIDGTFITEIEDMLYYVENVVKTPKRFIKDDPQLVPVERAKKINSLSVRHLASHTNYIRDIDDDGFVQPSKILSAETDEDLAIYENRFVFSLINRLSSFIEVRHNQIAEKNINRNTTKLKLNSDFTFGNAVVNYDLALDVKVPSTDKNIIQQNQELLDKLDMIRNRILVIKNSEFYKSLKGCKPVLPPIEKTNILTMHKDYKMAYKLWLYIQSYTDVGYSVDVKDKELSVDNDYYTDLAGVVADSVIAMMNNNAIKGSVYKNLPYLKQPKHFKVVKGVEFIPKFRIDGGDSEKDLINEYYYNSIISQLKKKVKAPKEFVDNKDLDITFGKFYRSLSRINSTMITDLLFSSTKEDKKNKKDDESLTKLQRLKLDVKNEKLVLRRYKLISKLKVKEIEQFLRRETTQVVKLQRLNFKLSKLQGISRKKLEKMKLSKSKQLLKSKNKLKNVQNKVKKDRIILINKEFLKEKQLDSKKVKDKNGTTKDQKENI
jgi:exonuclease SbcC